MTWRDAGQHAGARPRFFPPYLEKRLGPARQADEPLDQRHHNIAASMQAALEEVLGRALEWPGEDDRPKIAVPRGRRCVQLRGQRKDFRSRLPSSTFTCSPQRATQAFPSARLSL